MEIYLPLFFAAVIGFGHAFEADHLLAVSNMVTRREKFHHAIKDGMYWGLGHTSTIILVGLLMIVINISILDSHFKYFEAFVGLMLIFLGFFRLYKIIIKKFRHAHVHAHPDEQGHLHQHVHVHTHLHKDNHHANHHLAYGVGLLHGLAGSGAIILLAMTHISGKLNGMLYLFIFGIGSILGMLVAAGMFSLPFSKNSAVISTYNFN